MVAPGEVFPAHTAGHLLGDPHVLQTALLGQPDRLDRLIRAFAVQVFAEDDRVPDREPDRFVHFAEENAQGLELFVGQIRVGEPEAGDGQGTSLLQIGQKGQGFAPAGLLDDLPRLPRQTVRKVLGGSVSRRRP